MYWTHMVDGYYTVTPVIPIDYDKTHIILSRKILSSDPSEWSYQFHWPRIPFKKFPITPEQQYERAKWCEENLEGDWLLGVAISGIDLKTDYMAFKLRWM